LWRDKHFQAAANIQMQLIRVERLKNQSGQFTKPLWLAWVGEEMLPLNEVWRLYLRRFAIDHWYRFAFATTALDIAQIKQPKTV